MTVQPPELQRHWDHHYNCVGQHSERRIGPFVARIFKCAICGREQHEYVYRPHWWARWFAR